MATKTLDLGSFTTNIGAKFQTSDPISNFSKAISTVIGFFTIIAGLAFIAYFFFGAIGWITSQGDEQKIQKARQTMTNAITGIIITAIAYPLVWLLGKLLGIPFLNPQQLFSQLR